MAQLPSDVIQTILQSLDSKAMVTARRVNKRFLDAIDGSKSNWRSLVLSDNIEKWEPSILEMFDEKSQSSLVKVSIKMLSLSTHLTDSSFFQVLRASKATLRFLSLETNAPETSFRIFSKALFPALVELRLGHQINLSKALLVNSSSNEREQDLKVLWTFEFLEDDLEVVRNLRSLSLQSNVYPGGLRRILTVAANTLRHLYIQCKRDNEATSSLELPNLKVLEVGVWSTHDFPYFIKCPSDVIIIVTGVVPKDLPSCSELWLGELSNCHNLVKRCPSLEVLRLKKFNNQGKVIEMMQERERMARNGERVEGVRMQSLKKLILNCPSDRTIGERFCDLVPLVGEISFLGESPDLIEVEI